MIENVVEDRKREQMRKRERIKNMRIEDIGDTGKFLEDDHFESLKERLLAIKEKQKENSQSVSLLSEKVRKCLRPPSPRSSRRTGTDRRSKKS